MRLKSLFFPLILLVSVTVFIFYIWPQIGEIKKINETRLAKVGQLEAIDKKQSSIGQVSKKITDNVADFEIVNKYIPKSKTEEEIIGSINFLAGDASVSLVNLSLASPKSEPVEVAASAAPAPAVAPAPITGSTPIIGPSMPGITQAIDPSTGLPIAEKVNSLQSSSAKISIAGEYDKIKIFLDNLQKMPLLNTIKSVAITKQSVDTSSKDKSSSSILNVEVAVDFGFMASSKATNQQVENFNAGLNEPVVKTLKEYISQKAQNDTDNNNNAPKGKTNPFL